VRRIMSRKRGVCRTVFHADGTELAADNAVPPILGNVCVGTWKSTGPRSIKRRHMTRNWNLDATPAGTFLLLVTATVSHDGRTYEGTFVSDSFDLQGNPIPPSDHAGFSPLSNQLRVETKLLQYRVIVLSDSRHAAHHWLDPLQTCGRPKRLDAPGRCLDLEPAVGGRKLRMIEVFPDAVDSSAGDLRLVQAPQHFC
jgi:hypothetical protein